MFSFVFRPRKQNSAETAKERLQILLAHERLDGGSSPDYLPLLQKEILEVVRRHIQLDKEAVDVRLERGKDMSSLEINIELPCCVRRSGGAGRGSGRDAGGRDRSEGRLTGGGGLSPSRRRRAAGRAAR